MKRPRRRESARSRKGCNECHGRKIKCDEVKPKCGQCRRSGTACSIADSVFRLHPFTFSVDVANGQGATQPTQGESVAQLQDESHRPFDVEEGCNAQNEVSSYQPAVEAQSSLSPVLQFRSGNESTDWSSVIGNVPPSNAAFATNQTTSNNLDEKRETAFLVRRFAECSARWYRRPQRSYEKACLYCHSMNVFSQDGYFSQQALLLSRESLLVKFAMCANAAKQLGHLGHSSSHLPRADAQQIFQRRSARSSEIDFLWYGAKYYGKAIQSMAEELMLDHEPMLGLSPDEVPWAARAPSGVSNPAISIEARLVAACIMCHYEELSASWRAWDRHLNGIYKLLALDQADLAFQNETQIPILSPAIQPKQYSQSFWYFAQNDFEESFITEKQTRLNPANTHLWQETGLPLLADGTLPTLCFSPVSEGNEDSDLRALRTLLRLMMRINNYIFPSPRSAISPHTPSHGSQASVDVTWYTVNDELASWHANLPSSFEPDIVSPRSGSDAQEAVPRSSILDKEVWFTSSTSAIAVAYYHMAKILLLVHQPYPSLTSSATQPTDWLLASRNLRHDLASHAVEILAIALGRPSDAVRAHMVQPLYVAGRCLMHEEDQRTVIAMLRGVEAELGIATGYRVKQLVREFGLASQPGFGASELEHELSDLSSEEPI